LNENIGKNRKIPLSIILEKKLGHYACVKCKIVTDVNAWLVPYYVSCPSLFLQNATDEQNIAAKII
jgi:hypothetical protein